MKGFNLAKFKKIHEDKDWATLIHEDGHKINIAKAPLSHLQRKQLEKLAMHEMPAYAEGGDVSNDIDYGKLIPQEQADNAPFGTQQLSISPPQTDQPIPPSVPQAAAPIAQQQQVPAPQSQDEEDDDAPKSGLEQEKQAQEDLGIAQAAQNRALGKAEGNAASKFDPDNLPTANQFATNYNEAGQKILDAFAANKLDPAKYWTGDQQAGVEGHSKIAAGIGLLLSSFGQGIGMGRVGSNGALDAINNGINREIDRQKNSQQQQMNAFQMNQQLLGNSTAATLATQNQLALGVKHLLNQKIAETNAPIAKQQGLVNAAKIQQQIDLNNLKIGALSSNSPKDYPQPEDKLSTLIRLGLIPPAEAAKVADEIKNAKDIVALTPKILAARDQASKDVRPLTGGLNTSIRAFIPGEQTPGQKAFEGLINTTVKETEGTSRAGAMKSIHDTMSPSFGDSDEANELGRNTTINYLGSHASAPLAKSYGIDLTQYPSTRFVVPQGNNQTKIVNGVKYMRGPNGQAIPVK